MPLTIKLFSALLLLGTNALAYLATLSVTRKTFLASCHDCFKTFFFVTHGTKIQASAFGEACKEQTLWLIWPLHQ